MITFKRIEGNNRESGGQQKQEKEFTTDTDSEWRCSSHGSALCVDHSYQAQRRLLITEVCCCVSACEFMCVCVCACAIWVTAQQRVWMDLVKAQTLMQLHSGRFMMWNTKGKETMITFMRCHFRPLLSQEFLEFFASFFPIMCPPSPKWAFVRGLCLTSCSLIKCRSVASTVASVLLLELGLGPQLLVAYFLRIMPWIKLSRETGNHYCDFVTTSLLCRREEWSIQVKYLMCFTLGLFILL